MYVWNGSKTGISGHPGAAKAYNRYVKVMFPLERFLFIVEIDVYGQDDKTVDAIKLPLGNGCLVFLKAFMVVKRNVSFPYKKSPPVSNV